MEEPLNLTPEERDRRVAAVFRLLAIFFTVEIAAIVLLIIIPAFVLNMDIFTFIVPYLIVTTASFAYFYINNQKLQQP